MLQSTQKLPLQLQLFPQNKRNADIIQKQQQIQQAQQLAERKRERHFETVVKPRQEHAQQLYKQFAERLEEYVDKTCKQQQPDTLLHDLYEPGNDHYLTLKLINSFEKNKGKIPNFNELQATGADEDEASMTKYIEQKRREREILEEMDVKSRKLSLHKSQDIAIQVAQPNMQLMKEIMYVCVCLRCL